MVSLMNQFKIKDNSINTKDKFSNVTGLVSVIANKTLIELEKEGIFVFPETLRDAEDISKDQMILQEINDSFQSGNVMGFIGSGNEQLAIESRFSEGEDYFFQYLLEMVLKVPNIVSLETEASQDNKLYNLLLFLFPHYVQDAMRKGLFKTYIWKEYNDSNVRGRIDIPTHIKKNIPFVGKIAYTQREFAYDNYLMELIRHTVEYIKRKSYGSKLLSSIKDEIELIIEATPNYRASERQKIIIANQKSIVQHAYYHEYRALQLLCILILRNEKHQFGLGTKRVYGILFDGAWLWEEYINILINKDAERFYHPKNKAGSGAQWLFHGSNGLIYPDFIGCNKDDRVIADAKYKYESGISGRDYLQVLAYMFRFDAKRGYYLYPDSKESGSTRLHLNSGVSFESVAPRDDIYVEKLGLKIPNDATNYDDFVERIKESEKMFIAELFANDAQMII